MPRAVAKWMLLAIVLLSRLATVRATDWPGPWEPMAPAPPQAMTAGQLPPEPSPPARPDAACLPQSPPLPVLLEPPVPPAAAALSQVNGVATPATTAAKPSAGHAALVRTAALLPPEPSAAVVPARLVEKPVAPATHPPRPADADPVASLLQTRSSLRRGPQGGGSPLRGETGTDPDSHAAQFGEKAGDLFHRIIGTAQDWFRSDHVFDNFISPMTNPFLFEDPRSVTEARPLFIYQKVPRRQADFRGGNIWFYGTQARLAFTDRWSVVLHKLGGTTVDTGAGSIYPGGTSFAELWLGPKFTILRDETSCSLLAAGLQFQIPTGNDRAFQNTGTLSLVPYLSYAQNLDFGWRLGSLNALVGTGYAFSVTAHRSDYYYLSAQVDLDTFNNHRFYPLTGLNWIVYTANGKERPFIGAEGRDLLNVGGIARGKGMLTWAIGARYKIHESAQLGGAFELPLAGPRDFFSYRFTVDFILRY